MIRPQRAVQSEQSCSVPGRTLDMIGNKGQETGNPSTEEEPCLCKHRPRARVIQQRLVVFHEELIELHRSSGRQDHVPEQLSGDAEVYAVSDEGLGERVRVVDLYLVAEAVDPV